MVKTYVAIRNDEIPRAATIIMPGMAQDAYHLGFEARDQQKGDSKGGKGDAIESAITQVLRGINGYIETLEHTPTLMEARRLNLLPVVFTTAALWVSDGDLSSSELETGNVDLSNQPARKVGWLWYQYHLSPGLKHGYPLVNPEKQNRLEQFMEAEHIRTVAIVSPSGIDDFLLKTSILEF